jgi:hypothetical protein
LQWKKRRRARLSRLQNSDPVKASIWGARVPRRLEVSPRARIWRNRFWSFLVLFCERGRPPNGRLPAKRSGYRRLQDDTLPFVIKDRRAAHGC